MPAPKMLTFDVFGTVVDWYSSIKREGEALGQAHGITGIDWGKFGQSWRRRYGPSMEPVRTGERGWVKLDVLHRENLIATLDEFGVELDEETIEHFNRAWHRLTPWPDSPPGLARLKTKFIIATLSNGHIELIVNMAKNGNLPWDVVLGAEPTQSYKPHPNTYLRSAEIMGLEPTDCMMVAAHPGDLDAAAALGFRTAYVHRGAEFGPDREVDRPAPNTFEYQTSSMEELATALGC